jgi:iron only hydrogenase large subunit-like protein/uncharacterized Fe-S cluster-containing protein
VIAGKEGLAENMEILRFKKANCKNCFKCLRECPVKAISFKNDQAEIMREECLICGHCLTVCPQNAKEVRNDVGAVKALLSGDKKVYASVAPSFVGAFGGSFEYFEAALKKFGFYAAEETAVGAQAVALEYDRLMGSGRYPSLISTACPTVVKLVEKYHPEVIGFLAPVVSPMTAHARMLRKKYGDISVVFLGPCISKKDEAGWGRDVDCVLTFEELQGWFDEQSIEIEKAPPILEKAQNCGAARLFPERGGILKTMPTRRDGVYYESVEGVAKCDEVLSQLAQGRLKGFFLEMSGCEGSCLNGPCTIQPEGGYLQAQWALEDYVKNHAALTQPVTVDLSQKFVAHPVLSPMPGDRTIREILAKTGKKKPEQELNCGACGYSTCREKAIAVYQGKAEITMCMPYMRERAEYISNNVLTFTPNAIIVLDTSLKIQSMNNAACKLLGVKSPKHVAGQYIGDVSEASLFEEALVKKQNIPSRRIYLYRQRKYVEQSVIYVREHNFIFGILQDVTQDEEQNRQLKKVRMDTVETADCVIEKQMRVVQEIARLLGETTAETKIALTKLKETMLSEGE